MDYLNIARRAYQIEVDQGRWSGSRDLIEVRAHLVAELGEVFDAHRKGRYAKPDYVDPNNYKITFEEFVKDSFEDEIADAFLVALVGLGRCMAMGENADRELDAYFYPPPDDYSWLLRLMHELSTPELSAESFLVAAENIHGTAESYKIDLNLHVEMKIKYNKFRRLR
ncbi:MAG: hypothetical protein AAF146_10395 [Bacteroidota bacterium]